MQYFTYCIMFLFKAMALYITPEYESGTSNCITSQQFAGWSQTVPVTFTHTFSVKPQVVVSWNYLDIEHNDYGLSSEVISVTSTGFTVKCQCLRNSVHGLHNDWLAFVDDNVFTQFTIYPNTNVPTQIIIPFPVPLSYVPNLAFLLNGLTLTQIAPTTTQGYTITIGLVTSTQVTVNIVPEPGFVINYLSYSILYGDPNHLKTGERVTITNYNQQQIFTPLVQFTIAVAYLTSGVIPYNNNLRIKNDFTGSLALTGNIKYNPWWDTILTSYNGGWYQYSACPSYCQTCSAVMVCQTCLLNSFRLSTNCALCQTSYYSVSNSMICLSCASYCLTCVGNFYSCTACGTNTNRILGTLCTTCPATMYIQFGQDNCQQCSSYCNGCMASATSCIACSAISLRLVAPNCMVCPAQYFIQSGQDVCQQCASYCNNCYGTSTNCSQCVISTQRLIPPNCLTCPNNMFIQAGQVNCQQCNSYCNQCLTTQNNCLACNGLYRTNAPNCDQCSMPNYYIDPLQNDCQVCSDFCNGCQNSASNCISCWPFKFIQLSPNCTSCPKSQFTLANSQCNVNISSVVCSTQYNRDSSCNCLPGYYNDENSLGCLKCSAVCQTCTQSATNCTTCSIQLFSSPTCTQCVDGYFMLYGTCTNCSTNCSSCTQSSNSCLTCQSPRINPPACLCPNGYFNNCTQSCNYQCQTCTQGLNNCLTCAGNRINPPFCGCPDGSIQSQAFCSGIHNQYIDCTSAAPSAQFSDDLNSVIIVFQYPLRYTGVQCQDILLSQTLQILGKNCQCTINQNIVQITLGTNATININSPIFFTSNLYFDKCNQTLTNIVTPLVQQPTKLNAPLITFNSITFTTTNCDDVFIDVVSMAFNGQRSLGLINWSIIQGNDLNSLIDQWNQDKIVQNSYQINSKYLNNQKNIQLLIKYQNFIGQTFSQLITIYIQPYALQLNFQVPQYAYVFDKVELSFKPALSFCGSVNLNQDIYVIISMTNETTKTSYNYTMASETEQTVTFNAFELSLQSTYQIMAQATYRDQNIQVSKQFQVIPFEFNVNIDGGDQQIGLNQLLNLKARIFDPNIQNQSSLSQDNYKFDWSCRNIITAKQCLNFQFKQDTAVINTTNLQPFSSLQITVIVKQNQVSSNFTIMVQVMEDQIDQITINGNQYQINLPLNIYENIDVSIKYDSSISFDVDNLTYQASYLDGSYDIKKIQFNYIDTSIDMNNYKLTPKVKFQVSIKSPSKQSLSVATLSLQVNIPPQNCQLKFISRGSQYTMKIGSCVSQQFPLSYQFIFYESYEDFISDSNKGFISKGVQLVDFQPQSMITTYLLKSNTSLIMGRIKDALNGLSNVTLNLSVIQTSNQNLFGIMIKDSQINLPRNLYLIFQYADQNKLTITSSFVQQLVEIVDKFNQSDSLTWVVQSQLSRYQTMSNTFIEQSLIMVNGQINNISEQIYSLQQQFIQGKNKPDYASKLLWLRTQLNANAQYVSVIYGQSQLSSTRRLLTTSGQNITDYVINAVSTITNVLGNLTKVNQNKEAINTTQFNLTAQKFTTQTINQNFGIQILNKSNQTAQYKNQEFGVNPYQNKTDFANPVKAPLIVPNLTDAHSVQIKPANPMAINFPLVGDIDISCASQVGGAWSLDVCKLVQSTTVQCLCQTLSPLSIVQALQYILSQFGYLFEHTIIKKINSFPYVQAIFTYIIGIFVIGYFAFKYILLRKDDLESLRVYPADRQVVSQDDNQNIQSLDSKHTIQQIDLIYTDTSLIARVKTQQVSKLQGFVEFLRNSHIILELYFRYDSQEPRILRLSILFLQILGQICIFVLFGKNLAISLVIALSIFQTAYGIVFQLVLSRMIKAKNKILQTAGIIIASLLTGLCTYLIIAATALYSGAYDANIAALSYLASFTLDYFISNILVELGKYVFILKTVHSNKYKKIYEILIPAGVQTILFGKLLTLPRTQTEIK